MLRTNARVTPLQAVIRYRDLLEVEALFRAAKASFDTRPIFHQSNAAIRGHVFWSFLALTLAKELNRLCGAGGFQPEWQKLLNDLDRLQQATIEKGGKVITTRPHVTGQVGIVFKVAGIALPHNISERRRNCPVGRSISFRSGSPRSLFSPSISTCMLEFRDEATALESLAGDAADQCSMAGEG